MVSRLYIAIFIAVIGLGCAFPAFAKDNSTPIPNAEDLIKHCWDISLEKRSMQNTAMIREGNLDTALCLRQEVMDHTSTLVDDTPMTQNEAQKLIMDLYNAYARLY